MKVKRMFNRDDEGNIIAEQRFDHNGKLTYELYPDGTENWLDRDEKGTLIHSKESNGREVWYEYDENNNLIHYKNSNGVEEFNEYKEGKLIHTTHMTKDGFIESCIFNNGEKIRYINSCGYEEWKTYNKQNKLIHYKNSLGEEEFYKYDENGIPIDDKNEYEFYDEEDISNE